MMAISFKTDIIHADAFTTGILIGVVSLLLFLLLRGLSFFNNMKFSSASAPVPKVPGLPLFGNLLQLKEKKPFKTFTGWAEIYGPIYSIQLASSKLIVLSTTDVAKEAMVTKFSSISTRKLSNALKILTQDKSMVAMSDYNGFHKTVKKYILTYLLGSNAQKRNCQLRESMVENCVERFSSHIKSSPLQAVNFREVFEHELFVFALKQAVGRDVPSLYVEELGTTLSRKEIYHALVLDMMEGAIQVDWRDFFPCLRWVPNNVETRLKRLAFRRQVIMKALIREHKNRVADGWETRCYLDCLLSEAKTLAETHIEMLLWETIIESADTVLVAAEWAMYELAKNPERQERLSREIQKVCGSNKLSEEHFSQLPYLGAVFHETLRKHNPIPIVPLRYVHEDTEIAGYRIPAGSEIAINLYGCNMDKNRWENPEDWNPERFMDDKYDPQDLYKTMAFGGGKRACAGSLQAMLIVYRAIGRFVQEFVWGIKENEEEDFDTVGLTTRKLHPLHTTIKRRVDA